MSSYADLINLDDFKRFRFYIIAYNNTSGVSVLDHKIIDLVALTDSSFGIILPKNSCAVGHSLTFYISKEPDKVQVKKLTNNQILPGTISLTAKVSTLEDMEDKLISCEMNLSTVTRSDWDEIAKKFQKRQKKINEFFYKLKREKFINDGEEESTD
jgi:hypothetical protein